MASNPFGGNSFTMLDLLTMHGLEGEIRNGALTRQVAGELRAQGYTLRRQKYGKNWYGIWSNEYQGDDIIESRSDEWILKAKEIVKRLPVGKKSVGLYVFT